MGAYKGYDIRGKYPEEVNEELIYKAGRATVLFFKAKKIIVGRDCRTSSLALKKSLVYGITDQGCDVIDTGYCSTPMSYYLAQKMDSLMITASHLPKDQNGLKITRKGVESIGQHNGLKEIEKLANSCHFPEPKKKGKLTEKNYLKDYVKEARKIVNGKYKPIKVLIDCGNGMAAHVVPELLKGLPIKYKLLYGKMDGTFPNHVPNPLIPENTEELQREVVAGNYDLGIAYDADCDRAFFIDEKGRRVRSEFALLLFAQHMLKKGESAVYTVNTSKIVPEKLKEMGFKPWMSKVGHTEIPIVMKKHKATTGGEISGHFFFKKFKYADSGDIAALTMMSFLSQTDKKMSELIKPFEKYATSEEINFRVQNKNAVMQKMEEIYKKQITSRLDGISVDAGDYWFNLRLSNTENLVRLNCEAINKKKLNMAIEWISRLIQR
ncbi:phosphomannomutase/phosphoglucomutase [Candidatus Woesearchaeota archaeon]|nr:phosphomannomutase/phosphoglucomutase [Candidatus Woesearchaeota archaeon]